MIELNKVLCTGRLTFDPDAKFTTSGMAVTEFSMAINRRGYGDKPDEVVFIRVTAWGKTAEFCSAYLFKGKAVYVEGRLKMDRWQDKKTGAERERIGIVADRVQFAESKGEEAGRGDAPAERTDKPPKKEAGDESDLPF